MPVTSNASGIKAGTVAYFAASTAPVGWLKCNGATVSRATYAALFNAIGTTYGAGDGSTTFAIPDLRGEFVRGLDDGRGVDSGRAIGSAQGDAMQGHRHGDGSYGTGVFGIGAAGGGTQVSATRADNSSTHQVMTDTLNGTPRTAAETRPRNVAMLACIKF